jgi:ABC-type uncharacterized transport system auxiliary subunit
MKSVYILEARWHDKVNRIRKDEIIGVFDDPSKLESAKTAVMIRPHDYNSISFSVHIETQPFHA